LERRTWIPRIEAFIAFGSIARGEWTSGSDLDWTLLIDGYADPGHLAISQAIQNALKTANFEGPGPTGTFGSMTFSHEIIHNIGGENDSNRNTTRRVLLLLESIPIAADRLAYDRVTLGVLNRYLEEDTSFLTPDGQQRCVPRFLLNDIVRFWRTMAVDYASKQRERAHEGWALRNVKLRMSRKLIFCSGMLMCFSCHKEPTDESAVPLSSDILISLVAQLRDYVKLKPLEILAKGLLDYGEDDETSRNMLNAYDRFLALIDDPDKRQTLKKLKSVDAQSNDVFDEARGISHAFQGALSKFFFQNHKLSSLTQKYGVF